MRMGIHNEQLWEEVRKRVVRKVDGRTWKDDDCVKHAYDEDNGMGGDNKRLGDGIKSVDDDGSSLDVRGNFMQDIDKLADGGINLMDKKDEQIDADGNYTFGEPAKTENGTAQRHKEEQVYAHSYVRGIHR